MRRRGDRLKEMQKRLHLTGYIPPESAVNVATTRTEDLVHYFWEAIRNVEGRTYFDCVEALARCAYLQGVNDAAVAMGMLDKGMLDDPHE
jgi:hypothetical protein